METAVLSDDNSSSDIRTHKKLLDLEYEDVVQLSENPSKLQVPLNGLNDNAGIFGMSFYTFEV